MYNLVVVATDMAASGRQSSSVSCPFLTLCLLVKLCQHISNSRIIYINIKTCVLCLVDDYVITEIFVFLLTNFGVFLCLT